MNGKIAFVNALLQCERGYESTIIRENIELLDSELISMIQIASKSQMTEGKDATSLFLASVALYLSQIIGTMPNENSIRDITQHNFEESFKYVSHVYRFFVEACQKTTSGSEHHFLNEHKHIFTPLVLNVWILFLEKMVSTIKNLSITGGEETLSHITIISTGLFNLSIAFQQFETQYLGLNTELCILGFESLRRLENVIESIKIPQGLEGDLCNLYRIRKYGDRATNLETSIQYGLTFLQDISPDNVEKIAPTKYNLSLAYRERLSGTKVENSKTAIKLASEALEIFNEEDHPYFCALINNLLACIHAEDLSQPKEALPYYYKALTVGLTEKEYESFLGDIHSDLGRIYLDEGESIHEENYVKKAIDHLKKALKFRMNKGTAEQTGWAFFYMGKGYLNLVEGNISQNIESAIHHLKSSLDYCRKDISPTIYMHAQRLLATAYYKRQVGKEKDNLELAEHACVEALDVVNHIEVNALRGQEIGSFLELLRVKRTLDENSLNLELSVQARWAQIMGRG